MAAKLIRKTTITEEFAEDGAAATKRARADDPRDDALEETLDDLGDAGEWEIEDDDEPPRRRRKKS